MPSRRNAVAEKELERVKQELKFYCIYIYEYRVMLGVNDEDLLIILRNMVR